nr:hypothetical protein [uncultured Flavobacterium sp.]
MENYVPSIDFEAIKAAADASAQKGALAEVKKFYEESYSPFRENIREQLSSVVTPNIHLDLANIMGILNDKISKEVDNIANEAIAKLFLPEIKEFLTQAPESINLSELVKEYKECNFLDKDEYLEFSLKRRTDYDWIEIKIGHGRNLLQLTLHKDWKSKMEADQTPIYRFLSLPHDQSKSHEKMILRVENGVTLEMPFRRDVLSDRFTSLIGRMIIAKTIVNIDIDRLPPDEEIDWNDED